MIVVIMAVLYTFFQVLFLTGALMRRKNALLRFRNSWHVALSSPALSRLKVPEFASGLGLQLVGFNKG